MSPRSCLALPCPDAVLSRSHPCLQMLVDDIGDVTVTNDGATILKLLEVQHPAAKVSAGMPAPGPRMHGARLHAHGPHASKSATAAFDPP